MWTICPRDKTRKSRPGVGPLFSRLLVQYSTDFATKPPHSLKSTVLCGVHLKAVDAMLSIASTMRNSAESVPTVMSVPQKSLSIEPTMPTMFRLAHCSALSGETFPVGVIAANDWTKCTFLSAAVNHYAWIINSGISQPTEVEWAQFVWRQLPLDADDHNGEHRKKQC